MDISVRVSSEIYKFRLSSGCDSAITTFRGTILSQARIGRFTNLFFFRFIYEALKSIRFLKIRYLMGWHSLCYS